MGRVKGLRDLADLNRREIGELSRAGEGLSIARRDGGDRRLVPAARKAHTSVENIRKWFPEAVTRGDSGRIVATRADRAFRLVSVVERGGGVKVVPTRGSRRATLASKYAHTIDQYRAGLLAPEAFGRFEGKRLGGVELEADPDRIDDLDATGMLDDFEFYGDLP